MFPKSQRIPRAAFSAWYQASKRIHTPLCTIGYLPHPTLRVSVVVSKKVCRKAVDRNRLRRRLYGRARHDLVNKTGVYFIITKPPLKDLPAAAQAQHLTEILGRISKST